MAELALDVVEEILVRLDVKDLIRYKSVCKPWLSLISTPRFVKAHLNRNIKSDRDSQQLGHRRIRTVNTRLEDAVGWNYIHIVGSCNGLVCVSPRDANLLVTNPSTRQHKELQPLPDMFNFKTRELICWGFGYDSSSDDYKVIAGLREGRYTTWTTFHVLTLKSNTWKVIGGVEYRNLDGKSGILCDGALYWFMSSNEIYSKKVIISLDLSTEELKEIPVPDDADYKFKTDFLKRRLGVIQGCLCIYLCKCYSPVSAYKRWVKRNNKWELYVNDDCEGKYDVAHCLSRVNDSRKPRGHVYILRHYDGYHVPCNGDYIRSSIFVKSLVSPYPDMRDRT